MDDIQSHTAVWTETEMIVWGGYSFAVPAGFVNTGGRYDPRTDTWSPITTVGAPEARGGHTAIWTGTEMIIWGGSGPGSTFLNSGGIYDPASDTWRATSTVNAPQARGGHGAVWTGSEMIIWGGFPSYLGPTLATGGRYDPLTDEWSDVSIVEAPISRCCHSMVWTGSEMIVWGGDHIFFMPPVQTLTGGRYDPATNTWLTTSIAGAPDARDGHATVWTGTEMIVWGGQNVNLGAINTGGRYDLLSDTWTATDTVTAPDENWAPQAVWTGTEMIVWGGSNYVLGLLNTGAHYDPTADRWWPTEITGAPAPRDSNTAVWTGTEMIIWGGVEDPPSGLLPLAVYSNARLFRDGFESGDTSKWSVSVP